MHNFLDCCTFVHSSKAFRKIYLKEEGNRRSLQRPLSCNVCCVLVSSVFTFSSFESVGQSCFLKNSCFAFKRGKSLIFYSIVFCLIFFPGRWLVISIVFFFLFEQVYFCCCATIMSAMCCVAPSSLMAHPSASLLPNIGATAPYYSTLDSYSAATLSTTPNYYYSHQQDAIRRKRLEDALIETIGPAASTTKVSHRIVRLQQSLYASLPKTATIRQRPHQQQQGQRMMSIDPAKDYSQPLSVDCSIEYDLPRVSRPPPGAEVLNYDNFYFFSFCKLIFACTAHKSVADVSNSSINPCLIIISLFCWLLHLLHSEYVLKRRRRRQCNGHLSTSQVHHLAAAEAVQNVI